MATDALAFDPRRVSQPIRGLFSDVRLDAHAAAMTGRDGLEIMATTAEHLNPRQEAAFGAMRAAYERVLTARDLSEAKAAAAVGIQHHGAAVMLERIEDERTYELALPLLRRALRGLLAIRRLMSLALGKTYEAGGAE